MARSNAYDFTKDDVEEMFTAMQETLNNAKEEFYKKFEVKERAVKKSFSFGQAKPVVEETTETVENTNNEETTNV